jgi:hypothetical protein
MLADISWGVGIPNTMEPKTSNCGGGVKPPSLPSDEEEWDDRRDDRPDSELPKTHADCWMNIPFGVFNVELMIVKEFKETKVGLFGDGTRG